MTQEEKQLLLKDLCARLPYGVKVEYNGKVYSLSRPYLNFMCIINGAGEESPSVEKCKPYLRPMLSMTEDEKKEVFSCISNAWNLTASNQIDWLNAHHFDYRGLIEKGLAIVVTEETNPYR